MGRTEHFDRQEALDRALDVFWEVGSHDVSVRRLAAAMGVNVATVFSESGDKQGLYVQGLEKYEAQKVPLFHCGARTARGTPADHAAGAARPRRTRRLCSAAGCNRPATDPAIARLVVLRSSAQKSCNRRHSGRRTVQWLFIVEAQRPWTPALRSRARVRTSPKLHLVDPALAAAALGAGPQQLRGDLNTLGTLFESAVVHDLTVLASRIDGEVSHYRDSNNKEIDAIITLPDGR